MTKKRKRRRRSNNSKKAAARGWPATAAAELQQQAAVLNPLQMKLMVVYDDFKEELIEADTIESLKSAIMSFFSIPVAHLSQYHLFKGDGVDLLQLKGESTLHNNGLCKDGDKLYLKWDGPTREMTEEMARITSENYVMMRLSTGGGICTGPTSAELQKYSERDKENFEKNKKTWKRQP